jgi:hypothetical protein
MLIVDGICTLVDVIIVDPTHANHVSQAISFRGVAMTIVAHAKVVSYYDQRPEDDFVLLAIEIFRCLHQQVDNFLHRCANISWLVKDKKGPPLSILRSIYKQKVLVAL